MSVWTPKHLKFCIAQEFTPTAIKLYEWLLTQMNEGSDEIVDLREFNKFVAAQRGKPHDFRVVERARKQLEEAEVIVHCKRFTAAVWRWSLRTINLLISPLKKPCKKSKERSVIPNLQPSNADSCDPPGQAAAAIQEAINRLPEDVVQDLETNLELCEKAGINYDAEAAVEVLAWEDPADVKAAIAHFYRRGGHQRISNPEGWLRRCLEKRWWECQKAAFYQVLFEMARSMGIDIPTYQS